MKLRYFNDAAAPGSWNMAVDETLGESLGHNPDAAFLRIYRWSPPTLSFGYNQRLDSLIDHAAALNHGYGLVRRATGGKMVFHNIELTFSLGFSVEFLKSPSNHNFLQMFRAALEPLVEALKLAGVPAEFASPQRQRTSSSIHCYAAAAGHSIYADDTKLIGAAALHRKVASSSPILSGPPFVEASAKKKAPKSVSVIPGLDPESKSAVPPQPVAVPTNTDYMMIHGSIPIKSTYPAAEIFLKPAGSAIPMAELSSYLSDEQIITLPELIATTYQNCFDLPLIAGKLSAAEKDYSTSLATNKYSNLNWPGKTSSAPKVIIAPEYTSG